MSAKRPREDADQHRARPEKLAKRTRRGFQVGPQNLPDGSYRRKAQKIKGDLVHKAKVRKEFSKLQKSKPMPSEQPQQALERSGIKGGRQSSQNGKDAANEAFAVTSATNDRTWHEHPSRTNMRQRPAPFQREMRAAQRRQADAEAKKQDEDVAQQQKTEKVAERERFRKAMAKARAGGINGQRKLGRESKVLLERVQRMVKA